MGLASVAVAMLTAAPVGYADDQGVLTWPDGRHYEGERRDGKPHGQGVYTWPDGSRYEGEWSYGGRYGWNDVFGPDAFQDLGTFWKVWDGYPRNAGRQAETVWHCFVGE